MSDARAFWVALALGSSVLLAAPEPEVAKAKPSGLGVAISPAHFPNTSEQDLSDFFNLAARMGSHVGLITDWNAMVPPDDLRNLMAASRAKGLEFHLTLSPITLYGGRKDPAIPPRVKGASFGDPEVRSAFLKDALALADLNPDSLGLGTEVNLLARNPAEFKHYVSLSQEVYQAVKRKHPSLTVTISFQWDVLLTQKQFDLLPLFQSSLDVYSFTTYPSAFKKPALIPEDYYACIRKLLPRERIEFSEVGWSSDEGGEEAQAAYLARLPELMREARPEHVTLALLHDVKAFKAELSSLNATGIRRFDGPPKKAWETVLRLKF